MFDSAPSHPVISITDNLSVYERTAILFTHVNVAPGFLRTLAFWLYRAGQKVPPEQVILYVNYLIQCLQKGSLARFPYLEDGYFIDQDVHKITEKQTHVDMFDFEFWS